MGAQTIDLRKGIYMGALSGAIWGFFILIIASITKAFEFDFGFFYNLPIFLIGGAGFGLVLGVFMEGLKDRIPLKSNLQRAIILSLSLWVLFFFTGLILHLARPERYTLEPSQHLQGLILSLLLGTILGILWRRGRA